MNPQEFRIGNIIEHLGKIHPCTINTLYAISLIEGDSVAYKPVPLTEEWLLKLGFEYDTYNDRYIEDFVKIKCYRQKKNIVLWCSNITGEITFLKHVHQLQNLFFALTGKELEVPHMGTNCNNCHPLNQQ